MEPMADVVAIPEPESAPKNMQASMDTQPSAPVMEPISASQKLTIFLAIPPVDMMIPASMKKGMAITVNEKIPE